MIKFDILNWLSGRVQFTAEIDCTEDTLRSVKLGLAVQWAIKNRASLVGARLDGASLVGASLVRASLVRASLVRASLVRASLDGARLDGASLVRASLVRASLVGASLDGARLDGASLDGASLDGASLVGARLEGASLPAFNVPQEGELTVWKKLREGRLAKLLIPADAKRTATPIGRKCRAEFVKVLAIYGWRGAVCKNGAALHDGTPYQVGEIVRPDSFDPDIRVECTHGIHFFQTREEAETYQ